MYDGTLLHIVKHANIVEKNYHFQKNADYLGMPLPKYSMLITRK